MSARESCLLWVRGLYGSMFGGNFCAQEQFYSNFALRHHDTRRNRQAGSPDRCRKFPIVPPLPRLWSISERIEREDMRRFHKSCARPSLSQSVTSGTKRRRGQGGLNKVCGVSPELQAIVGQAAMRRTEDSGNKQKIICNDALRAVFETDCTDMFKMHKLLAKHIHTLDSSEQSEQAKRLKVEADSVAVKVEQPGPSTVTVSVHSPNRLEVKKKKCSKHMS